MRGRVALMAGFGSVLVGAVAVAAMCLGSGCSSLGYYGQAVAGHLDMVQRAKPVSQWVDDGNTAPALRERLHLSQRIRDFASAELKLPDNRSYRAFAQLDRPAAVWNVVAAPELSLTLKTWCFPVMGCVGYRGYFDRADADQMAAQLSAEGMEVSVYGVPAYSTLGWTNWLGGDPLLSTFVQWPEGELARLIFHELAHQVAYASDDTEFNESFATAVEQIGGARWLGQHASEAARVEYARFDDRRKGFRELVARYRSSLDALYRGLGSPAEKRKRKAEIYAQMRAEYAQLKAVRWDGFAGYDPWFERANNAALGVQAVYNELVPDFERLFESQGRDFERFYAAVKELAALPKAQRQAKLRAP